MCVLDCSLLLISILNSLECVAIINLYICIVNLFVHTVLYRVLHLCLCFENYIFYVPYFEKLDGINGFGPERPSVCLFVNNIFDS